MGDAHPLFIVQSKLLNYKMLQFILTLHMYVYVYIYIAHHRF